MYNVKKTVSYEIKCSHCNNTIVVNKLEEYNKEGWRIIATSYPIIKDRIEDRIKEVKCPICIKKEYDTLYNSKSITDRIKTKYYDEKEHNFYDDICIEFGISKDHPKRNKFVSLIIDYEESWNNRYYYAEDLVELIK